MKEKRYIIGLDSERLGYGKVILHNPDKIRIANGITVIYGENGSGKTTLATIIEKGRYAYGNRISFADDIKSVRMLSFTDIHSLSGMEVQYHAQRMEATMNDLVPSVSDIMGDKIRNEQWRELCSSLNLKDVDNKKVNFLSSGELRKLLIINTLLDNPDLLILDNPYIGLDAASRDEFDNTVVRLRDQGKSIMMLLCDPADIPSYTDTLIMMKELKILPPVTDSSEISFFRENESTEFPCNPAIPEISDRSYKKHSIAFAISNGHIRYGEREIIKDLDWVVKAGERWALTGENGSGKSLLLSIICADNPQGYANDITLFDKKRGSGESIWEIKDAIGYVSPEMQLFFKSNSCVRDIIIQGLRNSLNRYRSANSSEISQADSWMKLLGISSLAGRKFTELSSGEQRLVLVARAMIKQPSLLVLDEPLHGLDSRKKRLVIAIVDATVERNNTSLIFVTHYAKEIPSCVTKTKRLQKIPYKN